MNYGGLEQDGVTSSVNQPANWRAVVKRLLSAVVVLVWLGAIPWSISGSVIPSAVAVAEAQQDPATITVYVTRTGEKYHRDGCRYLRQSRIPMSLKEAAKRFGPCSVCKPPTVG